MHRTRFLAIVAGLGFGLLVLLSCDSYAPSPSSSAEGTESVAPDTAPTNQPVADADPDPLASETPVTEDVAPISETSTPVPTSSPASGDDGTTSMEVPAASVPPTSEVDTSGASSPAAVETNSSIPADTVDPHASITRLLIPAIGVDAPVEVKSIDADGVMQRPSSPDAVAWYDFTARPHDDGNVVFAGHLDYEGVGPAVFWSLSNVSLGDEITVVTNDGSEVSYRITSVGSVSANVDATDIVTSRGEPTITLITCDGYFNYASQEYDERIIVTGERID